MAKRDAYTSTTTMRLVTKKSAKTACSSPPWHQLPEHLPWQYGIDMDALRERELRGTGQYPGTS